MDKIYGLTKEQIFLVAAGELAPKSVMNIRNESIINFTVNDAVCFLHELNKTVNPDKVKHFLISDCMLEQECITCIVGKLCDLSDQTDADIDDSGENFTSSPVIKTLKPESET